ncbi:hypothetical protein I4F81_007432 [Pyropia yezoensis]|uniref:Uncharacterized protein n=2 Tax=Pyropia yezoensis TaxID=2788 RepID=A0ACC3BK70_PYRYE|nr:hypothetical protein I4F81_000917 [Neopyropia yezoensis]KAK1864896.1 hypothetical protein I4F81_007432 [Neopyropia yezoensis]
MEPADDTVADDESTEAGVAPTGSTSMDTQPGILAGAVGAVAAVFGTVGAAVVSGSTEPDEAEEESPEEVKEESPEEAADTTDATGATVVAAAGLTKTPSWTEATGVPADSKPAKSAKPGCRKPAVGVTLQLDAAEWPALQPAGQQQQPTPQQPTGSVPAVQQLTGMQPVDNIAALRPTAEPLDVTVATTSVSGVGSAPAEKLAAKELPDASQQAAESTVPATLLAGEGRPTGMQPGDNTSAQQVAGQLMGATVAATLVAGVGSAACQHGA